MKTTDKQREVLRAGIERAMSAFEKRKRVDAIKDAFINGKISVTQYRNIVGRPPSKQVQHEADKARKKREQVQRSIKKLYQEFHARSKGDKGASYTAKKAAP